MTIWEQNLLCLPEDTWDKTNSDIRRGIRSVAPSFKPCFGSSRSEESKQRMGYLFSELYLYSVDILELFTSLP